MTSITLKLWGAGGGGVLTTAAAMEIYGENGTSNATQGAAVDGYTIQKGARGSTLERVSNHNSIGPCTTFCASCCSYCHQGHRTAIES